MNRRRDWQFFAISLTQIALITFIFNLPMHLSQQILAALAVATVGYLVDALTVRLQAIEDGRGQTRSKDQTRHSLVRKTSRP